MYRSCSIRGGHFGKKKCVILLSLTLSFVILFQLAFFIPSNPQLNPICHLLVLLGAHHILHVNRLRVKNRHYLTRTQPVINATFLFGVGYVLENTYRGAHGYCKYYFKIEHNFILINSCSILSELKNRNTFQHFVQISANFSAVFAAHTPCQNFIIRVLGEYYNMLLYIF